MKILAVLFLSAVAVFAEEDAAKFGELFTGAVYNELLMNNNGNFLVSPFSAETILALTQSGAVGTTGKELRAGLFLPDSEEEIEAAMKRVLPTLRSDQFVMKMANKVYAKENLEIMRDFQRIARSVYEAQVENIEFKQTDQAIKKINDWIAQETNNKIRDLLKSKDLDEDTKLVLINALYFQGNWSVPFMAPTQKTPFYTPKGVVEKDLMMIEIAELNFYESEKLDAKFLELPLEGGASLTIILPNRNDGIAVLEKNLQKVFATPKYTKELVKVSMPKFKMEATIDFKPILQKLGVRAAFDPQTADFSGLAGKAGDLVINKIAQKTYIDVNEMGLEAAAATDVIVGPTAINIEPNQIFTADHPFIFYLKVKDIILLEGRVLEPMY